MENMNQPDYKVHKALFTLDTLFQESIEGRGLPIFGRNAHGLIPCMRSELTLRTELIETILDKLHSIVVWTKDFDPFYAIVFLNRHCVPFEKVLKEPTFPGEPFMLIENSWNDQQTLWNFGWSDDDGTDRTVESTDSSDATESSDVGGG